jgi:capsid assembly protease
MTNNDLPNCAAALYGEPWAIVPAKLEAIVAAFMFRGAGLAVGPDEWVAQRAEREKAALAALPGATAREVAGMSVRQVGRVAVLPLYGTVTQRPSVFAKYSGGTSAEQFAAAHEELVNDDSVSAVVWDVNSPGGSVAGVPEAADRLAGLKGRKKTVAVSNSMMASAAYWLASAADEIVAAPSSLTGSIGVYTVHESRARANVADGIDVTYVYAGKKKVDGNPDSPLTAPAMASMQEMVNDYYDMFIKTVATNRKTSMKSVREGYGEGDTLTAGRAVGAGLADRVGTLASVVGGLTPPARKGRDSATAERMLRLIGDRE